MKLTKYIKILLVVVLIGLCQNTFGQGKFKVTLDAGHGDHDYGAVYHGHIEKNITLAVALKVGKILEKNPNIEVVYTRKTDVFVDLIERANIANRIDSHIFVSIHCNANVNHAADGAETYVMGMSKNASNLEAAKKGNQVITLEKDYKQKYEGYDPKSPESLIGLTIMQEEFLENSIALAGKIQNRFIDDIGRKSRGVKQAPFMVLHKAYMPRVLIEMGFISNMTEGAKLDSEEGQMEIAESIANAIISYKKEYFGAGEGDEFIKPSQKIEKTKTIKTESPVTDPVKPNPEQIVPKVKENDKVENITSNETIFKVQLSASSKKLDLIPSNFNGLNNISYTFEGNLYRYMYGETTNYEEAKNLLATAKSKGYTTAFLIAFKNGKKMSIQEALKQ